MRKMKIALRNHAGKISKVQIDPEEEFVAVIEISGDQIMVYPSFFDTGAEDRTYDFFDAHEIFRVEKMRRITIDGEECFLVPIIE